MYLLYFAHVSSGFPECTFFRVWDLSEYINTLFGGRLDQNIDTTLMSVHFDIKLQLQYHSTAS